MRGRIVELDLKPRVDFQNVETEGAGVAETRLALGAIIAAEEQP